MQLDSARQDLNLKHKQRACNVEVNISVYTCVFTPRYTHAHRTVGNMICSAMAWWGKVKPFCNQKKQCATRKAVLKQSVARGMDPSAGMRKRNGH